MPQYKYPVTKGVKWMAKFNYTDPKTGAIKTAPQGDAAIYNKQDVFCTFYIPPFIKNIS